MAFPIPAVDYRNFRLSRIREEEFKHVWYLLFWPAFALRYVLIERLLHPAQFTVVHVPLDDVIPFHEGFVIPYVMWYFLIIGMHLYTFLYDIDAFKRYSRYMIVAFSISTAIFLLFPTCQNLRPEVFPRDNVLSRAVAVLYCLDTSTNVCPSEHVIGSVGAFMASRYTESLRSPGITATLAAVAFFAGIATVFLKQHSVVDVGVALIVCAVACGICGLLERKRKAA